MEGGVISRKIIATLALVLLVFDCTSPATAATCTDVQTNIQPCIGAIGGLLPDPSVECCNGLKVVLDLESQQGVAAACNCTKSILMNIPGVNIDFKVSTEIQNQCKIKLGFSMATKDQCNTN